jgi:four helix bundle protein
MVACTAMSRDHRKLRVFVDADALICDIYRATATFPAEERFGLQTQIRRAAISTAANIVEGCARRKHGEYVNFLNVATGSSAELCYLLEVAERLTLLPADAFEALWPRYIELLKNLKALVKSLDNREA